MAGHSKWTQIKRQKSASDAAKSRAFSRLVRLITLESKKAAGVLSAPGLARAIARAKAANMPKENIERAVAKGVSRESDSLEQVAYEAYGPGGTALIIEVLTDNKNRTTQEIKHALSLQNVALAAPGAASWAFAKRDGRYIPNEPLVELSEADGNALALILESLDEHDDVQKVVTNAAGYENGE